MRFWEDTLNYDHLSTVWILETFHRGTLFLANVFDLYRDHNLFGMRYVRQMGFSPWCLYVEDKVYDFLDPHLTNFDADQLLFGELSIFLFGFPFSLRLQFCRPERAPSLKSATLHFLARQYLPEWWFKLVQQVPYSRWLVPKFDQHWSQNW